MSIQGEENIVKSSVSTLLKTDTLSIDKATNFTTGDPFYLQKGKVHFFFCNHGPLVFAFGPHYERTLPPDNYFVIFDSERDLPLMLRSGLEDGKGVDWIMITTTPKYIHSVLTDDLDNDVRASYDDFGVRNYSMESVPLEAETILEILTEGHVPTSLKSVFYRAKVMELFSYCYNVPEADRFEACPFLKDQDNILKIKEARRILIERMDDPPSLKELSREIGMNEYNLKVGFKNIYGMPAFQYLKDYKLNYSKTLLQKGMMVNEIADAIGYNSSSHYIEAFRKRYGVTPKKYVADS